MTCQRDCENIAAEWRAFYIAISVDFTCHSWRDLASPRRKQRRKWPDNHVQKKNVEVDLFRDKVSVSATEQTEAEVCDLYDFWINDSGRLHASEQS